MSSASEILALHKKILPAKYDKKRQPNIIGTDELPFPICITQSQLKGGHHFHFQHGPYSRRFVMCARSQNILTFPDFFPSSSELTYTVL